MRKRITALLLSLLMVLTAFPVTTWAAEGTGSVGSTMEYLNETERQIYTQLKSIIEQQAVTGGRMEFWVYGLSIQVPLEPAASATADACLTASSPVPFSSGTWIDRPVTQNCIRPPVTACCSIIDFNWV